MASRTVNGVSSGLMILLSLTALLTVLTGYVNTPQPPPTDEGTQAHIFQLSIAAMAPAILLFIATADWARPSRSVRPLLFAAAAVGLAFAALYHLEHP